MSRKLFITLILILFLLPFVSWYYLKSGLEWRKQAQVMMSGSDPFPSISINDLNNQLFSDDLLSDHVTLVTRLKCDDTSTISTVEQIYNQFKETKKALFIHLHECAGDRHYLPINHSQWFDFACPDTSGLCDSLLLQWPDSSTHALVDREKRIRSYYASGTREEKRILLEHMALLLPRERSEKVELKRGK